MLLIKKKKWRRGRGEGKYKYCNFHKTFLKNNNDDKKKKTTIVSYLYRSDFSTNKITMQCMRDCDYVRRSPPLALKPILHSVTCPRCHWLAQNSNHKQKKNGIIESQYPSGQRVSTQKETGRAELSMPQKMLCSPNFLMCLLPKCWRRGSISAHKPLYMPPPSPTATEGQGEKRCRAAVEQGGRVAKQQPAGGGC